jgi:hypothetical protein
MRSGLRAAVAGIVALVVALASPGVANADNNNNNTNTNDVTSIGNPNITYGQGNENTNWPPAGSAWPPNDITNSQGGNGGTAATPIVMPVGQPASPEAATNSTSAAEKPIVPVSAP